jgi:hypothetical protein
LSEARVCLAVCLPAYVPALLRLMCSRGCLLRKRGDGLDGWVAAVWLAGSLGIIKGGLFTCLLLVGLLGWLVGWMERGVSLSVLSYALVLLSLSVSLRGISWVAYGMARVWGVK